MYVCAHEKTEVSGNRDVTIQSVRNNNNGWQEKMLNEHAHKHTAPPAGLAYLFKLLS